MKTGKIISFLLSVTLNADETIFFSHILYQSRKDRDRIKKNVMADPSLQEMRDPGSFPSTASE